MDLETLVYLVLLAAFLLYRMVSAGKQKGQPTKPTPQRRPGQLPSQQQRPAQERPADLDEALQEIRRALGWEMPEQPTSEPAPTAQQPSRASGQQVSRPLGTARRDPTARREPTLRHEPTVKREPIARREPLRPSPRLAPTVRRISSPLRLTREGPSRRSVRKTSPEAKPGRKPYNEAIRAVDKRSERLERLKAQLVDPVQAREAFLLSTIFGSIRSRRRQG